MLRLDWNVLFNLINIIVLFVLLRIVLFKPVNAILEKRQRLAEEEFEKARARQEQAQECQTQYESLLQEAKSERNEASARARKEASREYDRIVSEAKEKAAEILDRAKTDAQKEKQAMLKQADTEIRDLVVDAAAKIAGAAGGEAKDRVLYDRFFEQAMKEVGTH